MIQRKCKECGSIFLTSNPNTKYCRICLPGQADMEFPLKKIELPDYKICLIVTTMNQWKYTQGTLDSLKRSTLFPHDTVVIDGASIDGTQEKIRSYYPYIHLIELDRPYWISYAWNRALEYALSKHYDIIGILNNDLILTDNWLTQTLEAFDDPDVGYASPYFSGYHMEYGKNRYGYVDENITRAGNQIVPVSWMCGACFLLRRQAVEEIGMFDEGFLFGNDEVDYCTRLWLNGWKVVAHHGIEVVHLVSKTIRVHKGNTGDRAEELFNEYGVVWKDHRQYFYEKWDPLVLDAIYETIKPIQEAMDVKPGVRRRIWNPLAQL